MPFFDHRIGLNAEQATVSVPNGSRRGCAAGQHQQRQASARIARLANEIELMGGPREDLGYAEELPTLVTSGTRARLRSNCKSKT